jgi:hypothetical protein
MKKNIVYLFLLFLLAGCNPYKVVDGELQPVNSERFNEEVVVIPEGVVKIASYAFIRCNSIKEVKFPTTLKEIGMYSFCDCENLKEIVIPEGVTIIGESAFKECRKVKKVVIPSTVTSIGTSAFGYINGVLHLNCNVPAVYDEEERPFYRARFSGIVFGENVTEIPYRMFCNLNGKGDWAWGSDNKLYFTDPIEVPEGVTVIGDEAFVYTSTNTVTLPSTIEHIGKGAFEMATFDTLYIKAKTPPTIGNSALELDGCIKKAPIVVVPKGCGKAYLKAWKNYRDSGVGLAYKDCYYYIYEKEF